MLRPGSHVYGLTGIDFFDQNVGMAYAEVRHICLWISLVLIYLIKIRVWYDTGEDLRQFQDRYNNQDYIYILIWNADVRDVGSHGFPDPQ